MKKFYSLVILFSFLLMTAHAAFVNKNTLSVRVEGLVDSAKKSPAKTTSKITDTRPGKPSEIKSEKINITPFKPSIKTVPSASQPPKSTNALAEGKILSNVKVYPNPVEDYLNLSYFVTKDSNVTIKIMDILGNEISTLLSQRLSAGEQTNSFHIASSLSSGYYFIRILVAGEKPIVKRISVL
jgi:hypothetical protein